MPFADLWLGFTVDNCANRNPQNYSAIRITNTRQSPLFLKVTGLSIVVFGIVLGMRLMHSHCFIHQALKPSTILIHDKGLAIIGDVGASRNLNADVTSVGAGTIQYAASELGEEIEWTTKVDVHSFGIEIFPSMQNRIRSFGIESSCLTDIQ
jgi:serine/threonine protein kinase